MSSELSPTLDEGIMIDRFDVRPFNPSDQNLESHETGTVIRVRPRTLIRLDNAKLLELGTSLALADGARVVLRVKG